jgi:dTDP-glucose 4,6-dehydratase
MDMRLLVTGGLGFIGSNFIRMVLSRNPSYEIINIDKIGLGANPQNLRDLENNERYRFIKGNINDFNLVIKLVEEVEAVINFAAETHVDRSIANPKLFITSNILGTFNLLEAERKVGKKVRHVQVSTDEIYGDILEGSSKEMDLLDPSNPYSATKASGDMLCRAYNRTYEQDIIITRCTNNFGPYQYPEKLIPKTIIRVKNNLHIPVYGTGKNIRDWIYVKDHCEAVYKALNHGTKGEVYNISSGNELSVIEIVQSILEFLGESNDLVDYVEDQPGHDIRYSLNSDKIRKQLGWKPKYNFREALENTVEWYLENEGWWKPLISEETLHPTPWKIRK